MRRSDGSIPARRARENDSGEAEARWRAALRHVNSALSLVVGIEYPAGGIQRDMLKQAGGALGALLEQEMLDGESRDEAGTNMNQDAQRQGLSTC